MCRNQYVTRLRYYVKTCERADVKYLQQIVSDDGLLQIANTPMWIGSRGEKRKEDSRNLHNADKASSAYIH
jgi:hypothetical protein